MQNEAKPYKGKLLYEVSYIRPFVIFLLVFMHSFSLLNRTETASLIEPYKWLVNLIQGFRIETIAFVAGYVFSFQSNELGKKYKFTSFVRKKFKRLIVPMLFFSTIYYFIFLYDSDTFSLLGFITSISSGSGHLWFLSMLFWCFVAIWTIDHYRHTSKWLLMIFAILSLGPASGLPFGLSKLHIFLFYVYAGYYLWLKRNDLLKYTQNNKAILILTTIYILLVIIENTIPTQFGYYGNYLWRHIIILTKALIGITALYSAVYCIITKKDFYPNETTIKASSICYGVYVYHQFICIYLYRSTPIHSYFGNILTPWVAFVITLSVSIILTMLTLKTRMGRFLIG